MAVDPGDTVEDVSQLVAHINVVDPNEKGLVFDDADVPEAVEEYCWCLVGTLLTEKTIHFHSMKNTLMALWKPVKGMLFRELGEHCYLFQFFHEKDVARVEKKGPWTFDHHLLLLKRLGVYETTMAMPIFEMSICL